MTGARIIAAQGIFFRGWDVGFLFWSDLSMFDRAD